MVYRESISISATNENSYLVHALVSLLCYATSATHEYLWTTLALCLCQYQQLLLMCFWISYNNVQVAISAYSSVCAPWQFVSLC